MALPGTQGGWENVIGERFLAQKFQPVGADVLNVYVNYAAGNDQFPGTGSSDAPYKTLPRALQEAGNLTRQEVLLVHLAGASAHIIPTGYVFPAVLNPDGVSSDAAQPFGFTQMAPVVIRADPTLLRTITAGQITAQNVDAVSGLVSIVTNLALTPNAYNGKWVKDANGSLARIRSNDATTLLVAFAGAMAASIIVYEASATISPQAAGSAIPTLLLQGGTGPVVFEGVNITATTGGALRIAEGQSVSLVCCDVPSISLGLDGTARLYSSSALDCTACKLASFALHSGKLAMVTCYIQAGTISGLFDVMVQANQSIFETMLTPLFSDVNRSVSLFVGTNLEILDSPVNGVRQVAGELVLTDVKIEGGNTSGILLVENAAAQLTNVGGSNSTNGLTCQSGGKAIVTSTVLIAGAAGADVVVGGLAAVSWANLRAGSAPFAFKDQSGSGVIQGTDSASPRQRVDTLTTTPLNLTGANQVILEDATAGAKIINLPLVASCRGRSFFVKKTDVSANAVTLTPQGGETIEGQATYALTVQYQAVELIAPDIGVDWVVLSTNTPGLSPAALQGLAPPGAVFPFGGTVAPTGWLLCDGSSLLRASFATLFAALGTSCGAVDGTHFNLPDYRGRFMRGVDVAPTPRDPNNATRTAMNAGGNVGLNVGSIQIERTKLPTVAFTADSSGAHTHTTPTDDAAGTDPASVSLGVAAAGTIATSSDGAHTHTISGGDAQTAPVNAYVNFIIKT